jgi:cyclophilin family peptidyl-prolyl cis-trans isomerase
VPSADKRQRKKENARQAREAREAAAKRKRRFRGIRNAAITAAVVVLGIVIFNFVLSSGDDDNTASDSTSTTTPTDESTTPTTAKNVAYPAGCTDKKPVAGEKQAFEKAPDMTIDTAKTYVATVETNCGNFDITLDAKNAPQTVNSFVFLANKGFYDGLTWHRLVPDFVIQGGDPDGTGSGGPGYELPDEPPPNGYKKGSVAMANSGAGTTGSQFFVTVSENGAQGLGAEPPFKYSTLGDVTEGFENVEKMMKLAPEGDGAPLKPLYINKVTITES